MCLLFLRVVLSIYADNHHLLEITRQMQLVQMGGMQLIALVILQLKMDSAKILGVALSVISVVTIDVNLEALAQRNKLFNLA